MHLKQRHVLFVALAMLLATGGYFVGRLRPTHLPGRPELSEIQSRPAPPVAAIPSQVGSREASTSSVVAATRPSKPRCTEVVRAVERACVAVVNTGMGTGVIIDPRGYIITNDHVVEDMNVIQVRLHDGSPAKARVLAHDKEIDLALLKIDVDSPVPVMPMGTSSDLMVGEEVVSIGNTYGYPDTVSVGNISALKRDVTLNRDISYKNLIQHTSPINTGNSGGPLLNTQGELVGLNVAIHSGTRAVGWAIGADQILKTAAEMMSIRKRNGTTHGLILRDDVLPPNEEAACNRAVRRLIVDRLDANGPAAKAGFQPGDIITHVGDVPVSRALELERALLDHVAGDHITFNLRRSGKDERVEMVLDAASRPTPARTRDD